MVIDSLVYAGPSLYGGGRALDDLCAAADDLGIAQLIAAPAKPPDYDVAGASRALAAACADRAAFALARVDPWQGGRARALLTELLDDPAVVGVLLHPWEETIPVNHPRSLEVAGVAAERGVPVVVEAGFPLVAEAARLLELAAAVAPTSVVATRAMQINMSGLGQRPCEFALERAPNLHITVAGMYREDWLEGIVSKIGAERVLFGSLAPVFEQRFELERVRSAYDDAPTAQAVLAGNAARLFGLDGLTLD